MQQFTQVSNSRSTNYKTPKTQEMNREFTSCKGEGKCILVCRRHAGVYREWRRNSTDS